MRSIATVVSLVVVTGAALALLATAPPPAVSPAGAPATDRPGVTPILEGVPKRLPPGIVPVVVPNKVIEAELELRRTPRAEQLQGKLVTHWEPEPKNAAAELAESHRETEGPGFVPDPEQFERLQERMRSSGTASVTGGTILTFDSLDQFDSGGYPPDCSGAAGPNHVVNVINFDFAFHDKTNGTITSTGNLFSLFTQAQTSTFDPKVVYDPFEDRFVIITLEFFSPPTTSRVLIAVSDDSDPNGVWYLTEVNSLLNIDGLTTWADYPGLAVDEEAIYVVTNQFGVSGGGFRDDRIWAVAKGAGTGGLYDGGAATTKLLDPPNTFGNVGNFTLQPADILGTPPAGSIGTFFTAYNGLASGGNEFLHLFRLDNPVGGGAAVLVEDTLTLGNIDDQNWQDAPQPVTAAGIDIVGPRIFDAVWQNDVLTVTTIVDPHNGTNGETTAHWVQLDTSNFATTGTTLLDQGDIDGEDIAPHTFTMFPAVSQSADGTLAFGFAGSGTGAFPGSYYTHRKPGDPAGTVRPTHLLRRGTGRYQRLDNNARNRWGDYSGIGVDPDAEQNQCFWVYNEHSANPEAFGAGTWASAWAEFCPGLAECGNDMLEPGETCDGEADCRPNCTFCGDGNLNVTETCEPPGGSCRDDCTECGDAIVDVAAGEQCDDGSDNNGDGCDENCILEVCGNGIIQFGETCDPPAMVGEPNECREECTFCGDTVIQDLEGETCDDGNNVDGDGCSAFCASGCGNRRNFFSQPLLATDPATLAWPLPVDIDWVEGDLSAVATFGTDASGSLAAATSLTWVGSPAPGEGRYKLVRVDCPLTTWGSGGAGECTGDPPGPGTSAPCRDISLP